MYEKLIEEAEEEYVQVVEMDMEDSIRGLYCDNCIAINKRIPTYREKSCVLSEEIGHYHTSSGDILDQSKLSNRKQEKLARAWGYKKLVGVMSLVDAYNEGVRNRYELAEYLNVTEEFLEDSLTYYKEKYGLFYEIDKYVIYFEPLGILEKIF